MATVITSAQNERLRDLQRLEKRAFRDQKQLTVVEGAREVSRCLDAGFVPRQAFVSPPLITTPEARAAYARLIELDRERRTHLFEIPPELYAKVAVREASGGILLVVPYLQRTLDDLPRTTPALYIVIEGVEKPGNLGAILRTADAAGVTAAIVTAGATDIHNPNVLRASLGAFFTVPLCESPPAETIAFLKRAGARIIVGTPDATTLYTATDMTTPVALVLGSEADGVSDVFRAAADDLVTIPMRGVVDSLNLATSAALLLYEAVRQRGVPAA